MSAPWGSSYYTLCSQTYTLIVKTGFLVVNSISKSRSPSWSMCWNTYSLRALSFWTRVLRCCTMHFLANDKSFFLRITCWYLYQSILFPLPWVTALIVMVNFQVSFLPPFFHSLILFILVSSFHSALTADFSNALMQTNSASDCLFFTAVSFFQQWHGPFLLYEMNFRTWTSKHHFT